MENEMDTGMIQGFAVLGLGLRVPSLGLKGFVWGPWGIQEFRVQRSGVDLLSSYEAAV